MSGIYSGGRQGLLHRDPNRTALFSSNSRSSSPLPMYNRPGERYAAERTAEDLEGQNEEALEGLSQKVKLLKNITINIGQEVRDSTKMLNGMNDTFGETGNYLSGTMRKMKKMARKQGGQWCLWMAFLFIVGLVFFWTWVWRRWCVVHFPSFSSLETDPPSNRRLPSVPFVVLPSLALPASPNRIAFHHLRSRKRG